MTDSQLIKVLLETLVNKHFIKNEADLCRQLDYSTGNLSKIKSGERNLPHSLKLLFQSKFGVNPKYFDGDKQIFLSTDSKTKNMIYVPLKAVGGFLAGYENKVYLDGLERREFPEIKGECFCFEVEGFSMYKSKVFEGHIYETGYKPGSMVVATKVENFSWLSKHKDYVFQTTDGLIIKTYDKIKDDKFILQSINDEYNPVPAIPVKAVKGIYFIEKKIS
jgi:hypothetical protein